MASNTLSMGSVAPPFKLPEPLTGKIWSVPQDFEGAASLLVMFLCNHCPYVVHLKADIVKLTNEYLEKGVAAVAVSSNSVKTYPEDGPEYMAEDAKQYGYKFPYLYDETQDVAKAYGAVCTPEFFVFKKGSSGLFELEYHGRFDDSRPRSNTPITGRDIRAALDAILSGKPVTTYQYNSVGCGIKWHP
ncbi:hypothetical protein O6H91_02G012900 [Diphasiastrum complanatum]|uniref:Uncharacterized protein n=2 Tax=Diphasiastrum complanatum TaxID=34168 RepID=A0ACC2ED34_DIPCM|nr:hypothetical protein O6H91_02G012900 [Diphasiastrum complanatum]